ncbi:MAG: hypothetical protein OEY19_06765 [Gammaproteobacteria bacterium]|nr:hypothetical protein [Gammaproteobacteria bacterium]MDH5631186.1 hypothetical protein [Gammaproteobacteria bacterium]
MNRFYFAKIIILVLGLFTPNTIQARELPELIDILSKKAPKGYYPKDADYQLFKYICNSKNCFNVISVESVTSSKKAIRRIAVFSGNNDYLGSYSGFNELPQSANGNVLEFPKSEFGYKIVFVSEQPPETVWIDGEVYGFEKVIH